MMMTEHHGVGVVVVVVVVVVALIMIINYTTQGMDPPHHVRRTRALQATYAFVSIVS
jgi:hypothetical protein